MFQTTLAALANVVKGYLTGLHESVAQAASAIFCCFAYIKFTLDNTGCPDHCQKYSRIYIELDLGGSGSCMLLLASKS